jgi:hypothetical protein
MTISPKKQTLAEVFLEEQGFLPKIRGRNGCGKAGTG